jgi:hypothetical protein
MSAWFIRSVTTVSRPIAVVPSTFVPIETPDEVILPVLLSRMEQRGSFLCERIDGANRVCLEFVARPARQADVIEGRQSTARCRRDVAIRERDAAHRFARET